MNQDIKFQRWTEYKALTRIFFEMNEPVLESQRASYLRDLEIFCDAARAHSLAKFPTES